jgi:hypothetical protein
MSNSSKKLVYCLFMELNVNGVIKDYDLFGIYSTRELAEQAKEWMKRGDGWWEGCRPDLRYNRCSIDTRIIDYNLPKEEQSKPVVAYSDNTHDLDYNYWH